MEQARITCPRAFLMTQATNFSASNYMVRSAAEMDVPLHKMYLPKAMLGARRSVYLAGLRAFNISCPQSVVVLTDSHDAFLRCNASDLQRRVLQATPFRVLISGEGQFSHQRLTLRSWFDARAAEYANRSSRFQQQDHHDEHADRRAKRSSPRAGDNPQEIPNRYPNVGGIAGRVADVLRLMAFANATEGVAGWRTFSWFSPWHDQGPIADTIFHHAKDLGIGIDYDSHVFHVATGSANSISQVAASSRRILASDPCFIHVPGTTDPANRRTLFRLMRYQKNGSAWPRTAEDMALARRESKFVAEVEISARHSEATAAADVIARDFREKRARGLPVPDGYRR